MAEGVLDFWSYTVLGMYEEELESRVDSLYRKSLSNPVPRHVVTDLLDEYNVKFGDLSTWLRGKVGDIRVLD